MLVGVLKRNYLSLIYTFLKVSILLIYLITLSLEKEIVLEILNFVIQKFIQTLERRE